MPTILLRLSAVLFGVAAFFHLSELSATEIHATQLLPETTVGYVEANDPASILATVLDHPLSNWIQNLEVFRKATQSPGYRAYLAGRKFFEIQIGSEWRPAVESLYAGGVYAGFDAATQGGVVLIRGQDEATMENFRVKVLELTRLSGGESATPDDYRGQSVYRIQGGGAVVVRDWLVVTNKGDLGKWVLDRLLDADPDVADAESPGTLSANPEFQAAREAHRKESKAWAFVNLRLIREAGGAKEFFKGKTDNPLAELLIGGIQSTLQHSRFLTADLSVEASGLSLKIATPWQADWIPESRNWYFGPNFAGSAPVLPEIPETLFTLGTYRDVSEMWMRAGDLFDEQVNDKIAEADSGLSTIFAGRDFGEEILGSFEPQIGLIVTRQNFAEVKPAPTIKLPAFALVLRLRDPETMRSELRRTFQSAIGFFNIVGAQAGQPQLEMDMQKSGNVDLITSRYLPEKKDRDSTSAPIIFNFSPSAGFAGDRFVLSSTATLAKQISEAPALEPAAGVNTRVTLNAAVARDALQDNREQLISQNMLQEGHSREEAEAAIDLVFQIVRCFKGAGIDLGVEGDQLALKVTLDVNENPEQR
jgi:hypothetical protein